MVWLYAAVAADERLRAAERCVCWCCCWSNVARLRPCLGFSCDVLLVEVVIHDEKVLPRMVALATWDRAAGAVLVGGRRSIVLEIIRLAIMAYFLVKETTTLVEAMGMGMDPINHTGRSVARSNEVLVASGGESS